MDQIPNIIMKCPKCSKEFPMDSIYCESCSAMLEPVEVEQKASDAIKITVKPSSNDADVPKEEKIDDMRIESLKADIEGKFICTALRELSYLNKRLSKKEQDLTELHSKDAKGLNPDIMLRAGQKEKEIEDIIIRTAKLESILDTLKNKIRDDIKVLTAQLKGAEKPSLFLFSGEQGRYYKMLLSELEKKNILMDILQGKKSPSYMKASQIKKTFFLITAAVVISLGISWYAFTAFYRDRQTVHVAAPDLLYPLPNPAPQKTVIDEKDILNLLEDIKKANMTKDLDLWESRYSAQYLELAGKKEKLLKQWNTYDFKSLTYEISGLKTGTGKASALITWNMELSPKGSRKTNTVTQNLYADFVVEGGRLKIASVRKQ